MRGAIGGLVVKTKLWVPLSVGLAGLLLVGCGGDGDDAAAGGRECDGVESSELEDIWGEVEANPIGGICSILVADGKVVMLTKAEAAGEDGYQELVGDVIGADDGEPVDIADRAELFTGTSAGTIYVVLVGDAAFRVSAVDLPQGQLEATARSIAQNL